MARLQAKRGEHFSDIRRVRHEPAALDMRHTLADQPPRRFPGSVRALTGDALESPLLADVVVTERDEPVPWRHLDTEEPAAAARARLGAAATRALCPRARRARPLWLRLVDVAFR
jgi:hypothetical protein